MEILSAEYLVTMEELPLIGGAIAIEGNEIIDVGKEEELLKRYPQAKYRDHPHHAILPGLINSHTHLDMSFFRDFPNDPVRNMGLMINFVDWLEMCIEYKKNADSALLRQAVEWGVDECIQAGTTCIADLSNYEGLFAVLTQKNMRAILFPEVMSYDSSVAKDLYESALAIIEKYMDYDSDLISVGAGPYAPYLLSRNILRIMSQYCVSSHLPLMMHAAESFSEMEFFYNSSGDIADKLFPNIGWGDDLPPQHLRTPVEHLNHIGFLQAKPLLVGCVHVTPKDIDLIAQAEAKIVLTLRSNHYLQQGYAPLQSFRNKKINCVLGTDGIPSVNNLSLWDEMRFLLKHYQDDLKISGHELLSMVTSQAAKALGLDHEIGTLKKGKKADLIIVDIKDVDRGGDFLLNLVGHVKDYHVHRVMIDGQIVKDLM